MKRPKCESSDVDKRLASVREKVIAGEHFETTLELFRLTYFPGYDELAAVEAIRVWCGRHGLEPDLKERRVDAAGKSFRVIYLTITDPR